MAKFPFSAFEIRNSIGNTVEFHLCGVTFYTDNARTAEQVTRYLRTAFYALNKTENQVLKKLASYKSLRRRR